MVGRRTKDGVANRALVQHVHDGDAHYDVRRDVRCDGRCDGHCGAPGDANDEARDDARRDGRDARRDGRDAHRNHARRDGHNAGEVAQICRPPDPNRARTCLARIVVHKCNHKPSLHTASEEIGDGAKICHKPSVIRFS